MSMKGILVGAGLLGGAAMAVSRASSEDIRGCGEAVSNLVGGLGEKAAGSSFFAGLKEKIAGLSCGPAILSAGGKVADGVGSGFSKFIGALADSKAEAEAGHGSFFGNVASKLTDCVADAADFVSEKLRGGPKDPVPVPEGGQPGVDLREWEPMSQQGCESPDGQPADYGMEV